MFWWIAIVVGVLALGFMLYVWLYWGDEEHTDLIPLSIGLICLTRPGCFRLAIPILSWYHPLTFPTR